MKTEDKLLLRALRRRPCRAASVLAHAASRPLSAEYREKRAQAGSFLSLCFNPDLATEVTLQPVHRYGMDAAILFCDILVVPLALGQEVGFQEGEGPKLDPITNAAVSPACPRRSTSASLNRSTKPCAGSAVNCRPRPR